MKKKWSDLIEFALIVGCIICLNIIFTRYFLRIDLTEDKKYTLAPVTKNILNRLDDKVFVEVFLDGDLDPDHERLKKTIREKLDEFRIYAPAGLVYSFVDPGATLDKQTRDNNYAQLVKKGLQYRYHLQEKAGKKEEKMIFPGALIHYKNKEIPVMFLKGKKALPLAEELNQAVEGVEFHLISAFRKLENHTTRNIAFVEGHGELSRSDVADITNALFEFYNVDRIDLSKTKDLEQYATLIVAGPKEKFSEEHKFMMDQYLMNGGSLMYLIDAVNVHKDSLINGVTYGLSYQLDLDDQLFRYGVRLNHALIQDKFSGLIYVQTGPGEGHGQMLSYPFYPVLYNFSKHPIVRNLDAVITRFLGAIDTVKAPGVSKMPLMFTSRDSKVLNAPLQIDLNELRRNSDPASFNAGQHAVGYLLEGDFTSLYKNRPLPVPTESFKERSGGAGKVLVISDADIIRNEYDMANKGKLVPLGYDMHMRYLFSNKDLILNAIDHLAGEQVVNVRAKEIKIRPLDKEQIYESRFTLQVLNILVPVILIITFGIFRFWYRKRKYENF